MAWKGNIINSLFFFRRCFPTSWQVDLRLRTSTTRNRKATLASAIYSSGVMAAPSPFGHFYMTPLTHHQHPLGQAILEIISVAMLFLTYR
jgi:hypothetical protein